MEKIKLIKQERNRIIQARKNKNNNLNDDKGKEKEKLKKKKFICLKIKKIIIKRSKKKK